jgi:hypothetical protein
MNKSVKFQKAIQDFQKKYRNSTSADLQSFTLGWMEAFLSIEKDNQTAIEIVNCSINSLKQQYDIPYQGYQAYCEINYAIIQLEEVLSELKDKLKK